MTTAIIPVAHSVYEWIQGAVDKSQKRTGCILESSCVIPAIANAWKVWLGAKQMISKRLAMPTIRVIFPRILALLSAEATVERLVLCTMWINKTSIMKLEGIILKKTWMIPTNGRCFFQTTTYCRVQLVKKKRIALQKGGATENKWQQPNSEYVNESFWLKVLLYLNCLITAYHRSVTKPKQIYAENTKSWKRSIRLQITRQKLSLKIGLLG